MQQEQHASGRPDSTPATAPRWEAPAWRVQPLDCEISAYAPDDRPLF